ncbi:ribonuclease p mrp [Fusarium albosuccineum]|uniref:Ribonuclease p mrp n=1 Tax=Fusarium albosuccineum TaxID=1237068 RepID=A0A8H4L995_9HYPO|nr:ribonuclease p mrp [Fusarium albosuccineum]
MSSYGLREVHSGEDAKVDIIFLHGLRGEIEQTWTKDGVFWPKDLLPSDVPESRIFVFGYDANILSHDQSGATKTEIHSDAEDICAKLAAKRLETNTVSDSEILTAGQSDRPIIFVAHSLGGLIAAQALVHGERRTGNSNATSVTKHLRGMIFLGTPFRGSSIAKLAEIARRVLDFFKVDTQQHTLKLLGVNSERLDELLKAFSDILYKRRQSAKSEDQLEVFFFYETLRTWVGVRSIQIVEAESAFLPGCGEASPIRADHIGICKFNAIEDEGYGVVVAAIRKVMLPTDTAPSQRIAYIYLYDRITKPSMC